MAAETYQWRNALRWSTNGDFFQFSLVSNELYPQGTPVATSYRAYPIKLLDLSPRLSSPRKIVECCTAKPLHSPSYLFCLVPSSHRSCTIYTIIQVTFIHTIMHPYISTFIHSYIHSYTTYTQHHSYMIALITQSFVWLYHFSSVLTHHYVKWQVLTNEQLVIIIFIKSVTLSVSGQEMSPINHLKWQVLTNEQLVIIIFIKSVIPSVSGPEMSLIISPMDSGKLS